MKSPKKWKLVLGLIFMLGGAGEIITQRAGKITTPVIVGGQAVLVGIGTVIIGAMLIQNYLRER